MIADFVKTISVAGTLIVASSGAFASTFMMDWTPTGPYGYPGDYGWDTFYTRPNLSGGQIVAGAFDLEATLPDTSSFNFTAFSLNMDSALIRNKEYSTTSAPFGNGGPWVSDAQQQAIQDLFDMADPLGEDLVSTEIYSAGFQLALLEVLYETTGNPYTLDDESETVGFYATPTDYSDPGEVGAVNYANSLLARLNGVQDWVSGTYSVFYLQSTGNETDNLVSGYRVGTEPPFPAPVPLPATALLMAAGAGALAFVGRRRRRS